MGRFEVAEFAVEAVVLQVGDRGACVDVIGAVVRPDLGGQFGVSRGCCGMRHGGGKDGGSRTRVQPVAERTSGRNSDAGCPLQMRVRGGDVLIAPERPSEGGEDVTTPLPG